MTTVQPYLPGMPFTHRIAVPTVLTHYALEDSEDEYAENLAEALEYKSQFDLGATGDSYQLWVSVNLDRGYVTAGIRFDPRAWIPSLKDLVVPEFLLDRGLFPSTSYSFKAQQEVLIGDSPDNSEWRRTRLSELKELDETQGLCIQFKDERLGVVLTAYAFDVGGRLVLDFNEEKLAGVIQSDIRVKCLQELELAREEQRQAREREQQLLEALGTTREAA